MGRKKIPADQKKIAVVIHVNQYKVDKIGMELLKILLTRETERLYEN
jgi:hypothetical protein